MPIFGKLADLYKCRMLFLVSIGIFLLASIAAGCAGNMTALILARVVQGVGAGGIFALVYIILVDVAIPEKRGRTLSTASSVWGIASVLGPTLGGIIVTYGSWRWVFFLNLPLGVASLWGVGRYFTDIRPKKEKIALDFQGVATLSTAILALLFALLLGGRTHPWSSPLIAGLLAVAVLGLLAFIYMVSLSLGWSLGAMALGRVIDRLGYRSCALAGAASLVAGCGLTLAFTAASPLWFCFSAFFVVGVGMGFVALSTLLVVQSCLAAKDLGVATASNQFARTLGGTVGVGVCGSMMAARLSGLKTALGNAGGIDRLPDRLASVRADQIEEMLPALENLEKQFAAGLETLTGKVRTANARWIFMQSCSGDFRTTTRSEIIWPLLISKRVNPKKAGICWAVSSPSRITAAS